MKINIFGCNLYKGSEMMQKAVSLTLYNKYNIKTVIFNKKQEKLLGNPENLYYTLDDTRQYEAEYNNIKKFLQDNNVEELHFSCLIITKQLNNKSAILLKQKYKTNFKSVWKIQNLLLFVKVANDLGITVKQHITDPASIDLSKHYTNTTADYILNSKDLSYFSFYEPGLYQIIDNLPRVDKTKDFVFYVTNFWNRRDFIVDILNKTNINNSDIRVIYNNKQGISQLDYYKLVKTAKYSCIVPNTDLQVFSIMRLFEEIFCETIPLIYRGTYLEEVKNTYPEIYDLLIKYDLFFKDEIELTNKIKNKAVHDFIKEVNETQTIKNIKGV